MPSKTKLVFLTGSLVSLFLMLPASLRADMTYTYTDTPVNTVNGTFGVTVTLDTTLTGAALDNLAPGTNISGTLVNFTMSSGTVFLQDNLGFPSTDIQFLGSPTVLIGTNSVGKITSWNVSQTLFVSYPAFPGENLTDFYALYTVRTTQTGDTITLLQDHDWGLAPTYRSVVSPGAWSPTSAGPGPVSAPEPSGFVLIGSGLVTGLAFAARRKRQASPPV